MASILVVDDEPKMTSLVCGELEDAGHRVTTTVKPAEALQLIAAHSYDVVITDLSMPEISGMEVLDKALAKEGTQVVMMTAYGSVETAVEALKKGAADYLLKPFSLEELVLLVDKLVEQQRQSSLSGYYRRQIRDRVGTTFVGDSPAARRAMEMLAKVAKASTTVLLTGNSGTGKEVAARILHDRSPRHDQPFVAVNCAALTETLLESELFGHEKGAFTGATSRKRGLFELADKGTAFLDEVGEMSPALQSKLLRVLEERRLVRVGGVDAIDIDVRIVAATNRNLRMEIEQGRFREDLFFRLNVFPIRLPDLVERREDIIPLAQHFLSQAKYPNRQLSQEVRALLQQYDWPGNVRELKNVLERATILAGGEPLTVDDFSLETDDQPIHVDGLPASPAGQVRGLEEVEKEMILQALENTNRNKTEAARALKISRRRLYSRMKVHGIEV